MSDLIKRRKMGNVKETDFFGDIIKSLNKILM
jgi:hypothetical protein